MASAPPLVSIGGRHLGEQALHCMPDPAAVGTDLRLYCANLEDVDSALAVTLRTTIEFFGGAREMPVSLEAPADPGCCAKLRAALGAGLPAGFRIAAPTAPPLAIPSEGLILPATATPGFSDAAALSTRAFGLLSDVLPGGEAGYLAGALAELLDNSISHAEDSATDPFAAITHDGDVGLTRLAVADLGTGIESDAEAEQRLLEALAQSSDFSGGMWGLGAQALTLGIDARITVAAGTGRLRWSPQQEWTSGEELYVGGTTVIVEVGGGN
jgi:hypothetical protein